LHSARNNPIIAHRETRLKIFDLQHDHTMLMGDMCTTLYLRTKNGISTLVRIFSNYKKITLL